MNNEKGNKALVLGPVSRCCQSDRVLPSGKIFSLSVSGGKDSLKIWFEKKSIQNSVYGDNVVELSFLPQFFENPEKLDSDEISENLKNYGWSEYHILLAKEGVEKFKELYQEIGKHIESKDVIGYFLFKAGKDCSHLV